MISKIELQEVADDVILNWNINVGGERRKAFYRLWYRYLRDLPVEEVRSVIDGLILADKPFPPRVGEVRRAVMIEALSDTMTLEAAWIQAKDRIEAVQHGTWEEVSPLVGKALAESGARGTGREDHEAFTRAWRRVVEEYEIDILKIADEDADGSFA